MDAPWPYGLLPDRLFPNGRIWFHYPWITDQHEALVVHANWVKVQATKKTKLMRDGLWLLDAADSQCAAADATSIAMLRDNCSRLCWPIEYAPPGKPERLRRKSCAVLHREDALQRRRIASAQLSSRVAELQAQLWHPSAYAAIGGGCQQGARGTRQHS